MKTTIAITGQINGNNKIYRSFDQTKAIEVRSLPFNGYSLSYTSEEVAIEAIQEAYNNMKDEEYEVELIAGTRLLYDASKAIIEFN